MKVICVDIHGEPLIFSPDRHEAFRHTDPQHPSFDLLRSAGFRIEPYDNTETIAEESLVVPRCSNFDRLHWIAERLLGPGGCPWDQAQTHDSLKPYLIEESYELFDALDSGDSTRINEELGDVLLQPVMHAQMRSISGSDSIESVIQGICDKLVYRHPHVFGDVECKNAAEVLKNWDSSKKKERVGQASSSILHGIPKGMPALARANEVAKRAARAGFDWQRIEEVWTKVIEEINEFSEASLSRNETQAAKELGDLLLSLVNVARWHAIDAEAALQGAVTRFISRFKFMELAADIEANQPTPQRWDELWEMAKDQVG